jgi:reactive intermediate/imine deaminase
MFKQQIQPKDFTPTMGAYSHGLKVDMGNSDIIFVTGQIAMDKNGEPVAPGNIIKQTEFIFENIQKILNEAGSSIDDVVKTVIYVKKISNFKEISAVRNKYFTKAKPVSTLVEISNTVKPNCDVEIEVIAIKQK